MFELKVSGSWDKVYKSLRQIEKFKFDSAFNEIAQKGVNALELATPKQSGLAAGSWGYVVNDDSIEWHNYDIEGGCNVIILIEKGHGLRQGGYVQGHEFVDSALRPVFDSIIEKLWKEVNRL